MPDISAIQNTPDVSFIDNKTIDDVRGDMVADFEAFMLQATGSKVSLGRASVHRMILYSAAAQIYQAMQYVDRAGKQSLLKYSYSEFLDNLALLKGVTREPAKAATTTIRFTASATRTLATPIPAGTRVSSSGSIYFSTMEYAEIPAGSLTVDVLAECTATGNAGNGLAPGEVSTIVDPVPYITSAVNQNTTEGGADVENDESLAERVYLAPGAYSTAGPEDGYLYHAKKYNAAIGDVVATSDHEAGQVDIVFIMADGSKPGAAMISGLQAYLSGKTIRPMTDKLTVKAPEEVTYSIIGIERSVYKRCESKRTRTYYCHPYCSSERGSNEKQNQMIRRKFPKGTNFDKVTQKDVEAVESWLNRYPRQLLGWASAGQLFEGYLQTV